MYLGLWERRGSQQHRCTRKHSSECLVHGARGLHKVPEPERQEIGGNRCLLIPVGVREPTSQVVLERRSSSAWFYLKIIELELNKRDLGREKN